MTIPQTANRTTPTTVAALLDTVQVLAPSIAERAAETEAARRLPHDLVGTLTDAGFFRMQLPRGYGGGLEFPGTMRVIEALSRSDASVGWTVMTGALACCDLAALPRTSFDALFADRPDVIAGGAFNPSGTAERVSGGYRVRGRWGFVSGCEHCHWLYANCLEHVGDEPTMRMVVFSPDQITIEDTWTVSGLCGTGSHHVVAEDVVVPAHRTFSLLDSEPCLDEPVVRIHAPALYALAIASVAVGTAQGALDDIQPVAVAKTPMLATSKLAANPLFRYQLATADTRLRAGRSLLYADAEAAWDTVARRQDLTPEQRAHIRATAAWVTSLMTEVVDACYGAGGGSSLYQRSPLQRRLRDIHALTQHFLIKPDTLTTAGAVLAHQDVDLTLF